MSLNAVALRELPSPPARVLEIGCGRGDLARALAAYGYDVIAVDPEAPANAVFRRMTFGGRRLIFRRTTLEDFVDEGPFDAAIASLALHHVADLDVALEKLHSLLRTGAPLVVREFAWDLVDEPTATWDYERLGRKGGLPEWRAEHQHLHGFAAMRAALDSRFRERSFEWGAYLSEYEPSAAHAREERRLIESGEIRAIGFVYVGLA